MGLWGGKSFNEQFFQLFTELSCVCVCVRARWFLLAHTCVTHSPCHLAVPQYSLCALQNATFWEQIWKQDAPWLYKASRYYEI